MDDADDGKGMVPMLVNTYSQPPFLVVRWYKVVQGKWEGKPSRWGSIRDTDLEEGLPLAECSSLVAPVPSRM